MLLDKLLYERRQLFQCATCRNDEIDIVLFGNFFDTAVHLFHLVDGYADNLRHTVDQYLFDIEISGKHSLYKRNEAILRFYSVRLGIYQSDGSVKVVHTVGVFVDVHHYTLSRFSRFVGIVNNLLGFSCAFFARNNLYPLGNPPFDGFI